MENVLETTRGRAAPGGPGPTEPVFRPELAKAVRDAEAEAAPAGSGGASAPPRGAEGAVRPGARARAVRQFLYDLD